LFPLSESDNRFRSATVEVTHCHERNVSDKYVHVSHYKLTCITRVHRRLSDAHMRILRCLKQTYMITFFVTCHQGQWKYFSTCFTWHG